MFFVLFGTESESYVHYLQLLLQQCVLHDIIYGSSYNPLKFAPLLSGEQDTYLHCCCPNA